VGKLTRCLGAAALVALLATVQTERALAIPFNLGCGGQVNVDTDPPTLVTCTLVDVGPINDLTIVLEIDDPAGSPYVSDLEIILYKDYGQPTQISVVLYTGAQPAGPTAYMDATFDDAAAAPAPTSGNVIGTYLPVDALAAFDGVELSGNWTLSLHDTTIWPNEGIDLVGWGMVGDHAPEPSTAILLAIGLFGLAAAGRRRPARGNAEPRRTRARPTATGASAGVLTMVLASPRNDD
jgi:hypothetical protein